jgi:hypothetical protein
MSNGAAPMPRRRVARALGAAASGLLGVAFLPAAAAFADETIDPTGTETITGIWGTGLGTPYSAPPALPGTITGYQLFNYTDTTSGATGAFDGDESNVADEFGDTNQEILVTSDVSGTSLPVGSVFDTYTLDGGYENIYSAVPSTSGGDVISDTLVTPDGDYTVPLTFDAADVPIADAGGVPLADGADFYPDAAGEKITSINGVPPIDIALQGNGVFDVDSASDAQLGSFAADETTTEDILGTYTEAVLVTKDISGADLPPVGSLFNTINLFGWQNIYSDIPSSSGGADTISDTLVSPTGEGFTIPTTFDAAEAETPVSVDLPDGDDIAADPSSTEVFTGINGLPPVHVGVQGQQEFDLLSGNHVLGTFDADETKTMDLFGDVTQTLLVTSGNEAMPTGSVIETVSLGGGFENIYTDLASTTAGGDTYSEFLVTPFGDISMPVTSDLAAGLASDLFHIVLP